VQAILLFVIGLVIILVGFVLFFLEYLGQELSFVIMLGGLLFATIGSMYGRKKLMEEYGASPRPEQKPIQSRKSPQTLDELLKGIDGRRDETAQEPEARQDNNEEVVSNYGYEQEEPMQPIHSEPMRNEQNEKAPSPTTPYFKDFAQKVIKILICPKCGTENPENHIFCFKCGKKIRIGNFKKK